MAAVEKKTFSQIMYSCYTTRSRDGEQFIPEHVFSYQISGSIMLNDGDQEFNAKEGDFGFAKRNNLVKFNKKPPENGEYKSVSIYLDQHTLRDFIIEYGYKAERRVEGNTLIQLKSDPLYKSFMESLMPYLLTEQAENTRLQELKLKEAILILLQVNPELKDVLFDFSEPGKIDLEGFMNKNFHFNVQLKRFAYLTGRSLATFKRDFDKVFNSSPNRWLQQKRLQEAYYLIKEKGKAVSEVYLEMGFEDLSHFSFAFKKKYGVAPSKLTQTLI